MGFFEDMLDDGMRETRRMMKERGLPYEKARLLVTNKCDDCSGFGWIGHGMGGDTCVKCGVDLVTRPMKTVQCDS